MIHFLLTLLVICLVRDARCLQHTAEEMTHILKNFNLSKYSRYLPPPTIDNKPVDVYVTVFLIDFVPIRHRYYELVCDFVLEWHDSRLIFNTSIEKPIPLDVKLDERFWQPDLWIPHESSGKVEFIVDQYFRLFRDGKVELVKRANLQMFCDMEFWYYPFDRQLCPIMFQSFAYTIDAMRLNWNYEEGDDGYYGVVNSIPSVSMTNFELKLHNISQVTLNSGRYDVFDSLQLQLELKRSYSYHISQDYVPYNLVILLSMTSFWIDHNCVPARVAIPLIVVLTLTKLNIVIKTNFPFTRDPLMAEYYMNFSVLFVLAVMAEYCMVTMSKLKAKKKELKKLDEEKYNNVFTIQGGYIETDFLDVSVTAYEVNKNERSYIIHPIDKKCRSIFPLVFLAYNIFYFATCAIHHAKSEHTLE